ncbi:MAG: hypothetical protein RIQ81_1195 [Pseudomonadota bacterium]|jgi:uncharacterized metal-binding protein YceD (DUF177 family)
MKVSVKDLKKPLNIRISGNEAWLGAIHASFTPEVGDACAPGVQAGDRQLTGDLELSVDSAGCVRVTGRLDYQPLVPCSRCDLSIPFDVGQDVDSCFKPLPSHTDDRREVNLSGDELDERYIEDGAVDIEELLNDLVQTAIPFQTVQVSPDGKNCVFCKADLSRPRVFSSGGEDEPEAPESPFAKLAGFKVKK